MKDRILMSMIFAKQLELITLHFQNNKTLDWDTCLEYLKEGLKTIQDDNEVKKK